MRARYDEFASWYDRYVTSGAGSAHARSADRLLSRLLGPGRDRSCLDLGCGTGAHVPALTGLGWRVTGVDISTRQIELARQTGIAATVAHAAALPFEDQSFDAVATIMTTTDFDDLSPVFVEARRVLRPGGCLVVVAAHPCFGGAFAEVDGQGACIVHPGYRRHVRIEQHPLLGDGIRSRVGVVNVPLPVLLNAVTEAGFVLLETAEDDGDQPLPQLFGLTALRLPQ
ncbi:class I SAM-dependent DNA methyltransferase [Phytoactinopolyspora halotolerans]|uniref:Class I SAM-dependent methyltransferase n=1 Tax=Phytoactinopolyspora halotolerans TaxID=1981512 RepID=A0A6L9SI37_9ACTN|nr:class I SAM-dependent methyltransferase [Phytoactinopolyspora halotolerans]NEE04783.1 class I SAM-dependent methyltransferase [Phytoactinopolyspora halotolerans]